MEKGNLKLGKSILILIVANANSYKTAVCFNLSERDFQQLPSPATRSKLLYSPVKYVGPVLNLSVLCFNHFAQIYEPSHSTFLPACSVSISMSHSSLYQPIVTSAPCVSPVRITTVTFLFHIPNISYTNASIRSFSSKLNTTSSLKPSLSSH